MQGTGGANLKKLFDWLFARGYLEMTKTDMYKITAAGRAYFNELV